jgi:uncharacterized protein (TIGR02246 family)
MRRSAVVLLVGLVLFVALYSRNPIGMVSQNASDENAIVKLVADRQLAWNAGDDHAYAQLLTPDSDISSGSGRATRGRDAVIQLYKEERAGTYAGASTSTRVVHIRKIRADVALVDVDRELTGLQNNSVAPKSRTFLVVVKQPNQRWLITAQRAGLPDQAAR